MPDERSIAQILTELEAKVDRSLEALSNLTLLHSVIVQKLDIKSNPEPKPRPQMPTVTSSKAPINAKPKKPEPVISAPPVEEIAPEIMPKPEKKRSKTVSVEQQILYPNDKPVLMAKVAIVNAEGKVVQDKITNGVGKWRANLPPGKYHSVVLKKALPDAKLPEINRQDNFEVPEQDGPLILESLK